MPGDVQPRIGETAREERGAKARHGEKYVCAFRGRRDAYQVPLALAEGELLDQFITDAYLYPAVRKIMLLSRGSVPERLQSRCEPGIPFERVGCLWGTAAIENIRHRLGFERTITVTKFDPRFSVAAAKRAAQSGAHLLLYSPYAWEAFTMRSPHKPRKVLFQYHPHAELERRWLSEDSARFPGVEESVSGNALGQLSPVSTPREQDAWKHADLILCASTFTLRSLLEAGAEERCCRVIPYGIEVPDSAESDPATEGFHAVFVGSGGRRKGLHHLLLAWQRAALPASSRLTLVCRVIDRNMERLAAATPRVELLKGLPLSQLNALYAKSSLLAMPSLVEGFGQVYLEALAQGCPVLGTANTCLPDLGGEADGIFLTAPGNLDQLVGTLERLSRVLPGNREIRCAARACARRFTWPAFRDNLRLALQMPTAAACSIAS